MKSIVTRGGFGGKGGGWPSVDLEDPLSYYFEILIFGHIPAKFSKGPFGANIYLIRGWGARAKKTKLFFIKILPKVSKNAFFRPVFSKLCQRRRKFGQNRVSFSALKGRQHFWIFSKIRPPPLEKIQDPPLIADYSHVYLENRKEASDLGNFFILSKNFFINLFRIKFVVVRELRRKK